MLMLERPAYYILCPTCHSRGLRVGISPLPLHLPFPTFLSPKLSPLVFGHVWGPGLEFSASLLSHDERGICLLQKTLDFWH